MKKSTNKNFKKILIALPLMMLIAFMGSAFFYQQTPWNAPASADAKKNPLTSDVLCIATAKTLYVAQCQSCHGKKGKGDGPSAAPLGMPAGNFTTAATQAQSDGALYWKIAEGRKPMPSFKKKLTETQIWQTVVYMRTLK